MKINKLKLLELSKVFLNYFLDQIESCQLKFKNKQKIK